MTAPVSFMSVPTSVCRETSIATFQYLRGAYQQEKVRLFTQPGSDSTWRNGLKLKEGRFRSDARWSCHKFKRQSSQFTLLTSRLVLTN